MAFGWRRAWAWTHGWLPAGLKRKHRSFGSRVESLEGLAGHGVGEGQIGRLMHDHLQLLARRQQGSARRCMGLGRERDPVETPTGGIHPAGLQMQGQACAFESTAQAIEVVVPRFATGDHHEGGSGGGGLPAALHQLRQRYGGMSVERPGVFGIAPVAAHPAPPQADEEGAAAAVHPLPLQGMEGFHHRQALGGRCRLHWWEGS